MRVAVVGSRFFTDYDYVKSCLDAIGGVDKIDVIISGGARGADSLGERYARENGIEFVLFAADWDKHGKAAGPIRNKQLIEEGKPDLVVAFNPGKGTRNTISHAEQNNIELRILYINID